MVPIMEIDTIMRVQLFPTLLPTSLWVFVCRLLHVALCYLAIGYGGRILGLLHIISQHKHAYISYLFADPFVDAGMTWLFFSYSLRSRLRNRPELLGGNEGCQARLRDRGRSRLFHLLGFEVVVEVWK
jgi:hypothetical protein